MQEATLSAHLVRANHRVLKRILNLLELLETRELTVASVASHLGLAPATVYRDLKIVRELGGHPSTRLRNGRVLYSMKQPKQVGLGLLRIACSQIDDRLSLYASV